MLGLRFCVRAFPSCGEWGPLFIMVHWPLTIATSLVAEHGLQTRRLSSCGSQAQPLHGMWDLPRPGLEPVSPALAGRHSTTVPPGKPLSFCFDLHFPNDEWCWASFHVSVVHLYVFFGKMSIHISCQLFNWVVCFINIELYELFIYFEY